MVKTWVAPHFARLDARPTAGRDGPNARRHWAAIRRRGDYWHMRVAIFLRGAGFPKELPNNGVGYRVSIAVTQARGPLPDTDNRHGMTKAIRDAIAAYLHVNDAPGGIEWDVDWQRGPDDTAIVLEKIS